METKKKKNLAAKCVCVRKLFTCVFVRRLTCLRCLMGRHERILKVPLWPLVLSARG